MEHFDFSVVHLKRSRERAKNVAEMTRRIPSLYVHEAFDGKRLTKKAIRCESRFPEDTDYDHVCKRYFTKQHLAIWLSHVTLWEKLLEKQDPPRYHIIFEDDAILQPRFFDLLEKYRHRFARMEFAHLYVFPYQVKHEYHLRRRGVYRTPAGFWGLQCYMIPHERLAWLLDQIRPMQSAIDEQVTRIPMRSYFIYDDFVQHGSIPSENRYRTDKSQK